MLSSHPGVKWILRLATIVVLLLAIALLWEVGESLVRDGRVEVNTLQALSTVLLVIVTGLLWKSTEKESKLVELDIAQSKPILKPERATIVDDSEVIVESSDYDFIIHLTLKNLGLHSTEIRSVEIVSRPGTDYEKEIPVSGLSKEKDPLNAATIDSLKSAKGIEIEPEETKDVYGIVHLDERDVSVRMGMIVNVSPGAEVTSSVALEWEHIPEDLAGIENYDLWIYQDD